MSKTNLIKPSIKLSLTVLLFLLFVTSTIQAQKNDSVFTNDPLYIKLTKTVSEIPIFYNEQVRKQIGYYTRTNTAAAASMLGKAQYYYTIYAEKFATAGIPKQLFLICAINTNCDPTFSDESGATGMWPISYPIAKKYNLTTNSYIDERRNVEKSADAAALYLKDLYNIYQDWQKVIAAFRAGPINLNMAIRRAGNSLNYHDIHKQLNPAYQEAVVNYMAFWYLWNYSNDHKLVPVKFKLPEMDTVHVLNEISISSIAYTINFDEATLKRMNAELRSFIVPVSYNSHGLYLPKEKVQEYHDKLFVLFPLSATDSSSIKDSLILEEDPTHIRKVINNGAQGEDEEEDDSKPKATAKGKIAIIYIVKSGDGLLLLADLFDCKVSDIKQWNGMRKDAIFKGQKLKFMVPKAKVTEYKKINKLTLPQKKKLAKRS
ncbi:MAG: transglycosylase SLT domain-containing protein [Bacteroidia bacterium]|nr:transglycosylase SLT domain-containing protein [Bacteroidia bacterium]